MHCNKNLEAPFCLDNIRLHNSLSPTCTVLHVLPIHSDSLDTPFVCAVCHSKPRVLLIEIRRSRMGAFLTSYAHAFCTVTSCFTYENTEREGVSSFVSYSRFQTFQFHWEIFNSIVSMYPYERGSVSTVVCHLFVVRVTERSAVCSQALCKVSREASDNFERPSRSHFFFDSRQQAILV